MAGLSSFIDTARLKYVTVLSLAYTAVANLPYYHMLFQHQPEVFARAMILSLVYALAIFYLLSLLGRLGKVLLALVFLSSAVVLYFSLSYGYAQSKDMFALVWNTNLHEAMGVFSPMLFVYAAAGALFTYLAIRRFPGKPTLKSLTPLLVFAALCAGAKHIQPYEMKGRHPMPAGYLSHFGHSVKQQWRMKKLIEARADLPGPVVCERNGRKPMIVVLALGESLRADHLGLYGYDRETTPLSSAAPLTVFERCYSAGAGTTESVTRMLTRATIAHPDPALKEKSVITLFRKAGFRTVWLTNQGAMATGETPVASIARESEIFQTHPSVYTVNARIQDSDLLPMLDDALRLPEQDTLIVLHSFGSHINPEHRYADEFRRYAPVCSKFSVADCTDEELVNSYDNSVLATDSYWAGVIERLKDKNAVLFVTSDHGDRLHGKYRGHSPELMDHPELRWVPFMIYASPEFRQNDRHAEQLNNAARFREEPCSHDNLFHSLLGIAGIHTPAYDASLDLFSGDAKAHTDPYTVIEGLEQTLPL